MFDQTTLIRNEFFDPQSLHIDTKIIVLVALEQQLQIHIFYFGSHLGDYCQYFNNKWFDQISSFGNEILVPQNIQIDIGCKWTWASEHSHLGVIICEVLKDDKDITGQMQYMYGKGNTLIRKICKCSDEVKTNFL